MCKVIGEWKPIKEKNLYVLTLDSPKPHKPYWKYRIDGENYEPVMIYDMGEKVIGVKGTGNFVGKEVEFVA